MSSDAQLGPVSLGRARPRFSASIDRPAERRQRKVHMLDYAVIGQSFQYSIESAQTLVFHALQGIR